MLLAENGGATDLTKIGERDYLVGWGLLNANVPQQQRKQAQRNLKKLKHSILRILKL